MKASAGNKEERQTEWSVGSITNRIAVKSAGRKSQNVQRLMLDQGVK